MADGPNYTTVPGKIPDLLKKLRESGIPDKATYDWLMSLGFKSKNDRSLISVLRQIEFVDGNKVPTPAWRQYRGMDHAQVLGRAIRQGYSDLFAVYPDAHNRSQQELAHWFSTKTDAGQQAISKAVSTFKNLAGQAEFEGLDDESPAPGTVEVNDTGGSVLHESPTVATARRESSVGNGVTVNLNIQLTLPETADKSVYDAFFRAMQAHLLSNPDS